MSYSYDSIIYKLHSALKLTEFWPQYIEALSEELDIEIEELVENSLLINNYTCTLQDYLRELANKFGYTPNLIITNTISSLQSEILSIPYRIRNKTTYNGYKIIFKQINQEGEIYNYFYDRYALVKAVNWNTIYSNISGFNNIDYTKPFKKFTPDINYSTILIDTFYSLDTNTFLDNVPTWYLDNSANYSTPSKHLGIEYYADEIVTISGSPIEYLLYNSYFQYLYNGVEYNRRTCVFPHTGLLITNFISKDGSCNYFNTASAYSIPEIKLSNAVTLPYLNITSGLSVDTFCYASIGVGTRFLPNTASGHNLIFNKNNLLVSFTFDEEDYSSTILDHSIYGKNGILNGTTIKVESILGRSVNFNGNTYITSSGFNITSTGLYNYSFWFNVPSTGLYNQSYLFDQNVIQARCTHSGTTLDIYINGSKLNSYSVTPNIDYYADLIINNSSHRMALLLNNSTVASGIVISTISSGNYPLYIGANNVGTSGYVGYLDNFNVTNNQFNINTHSYIYNNKCDVITSLNKEIYRKQLQYEEVTNLSGLWYGIQTWFPSQSINEEYLFSYLTSSSIYTGTLNYPTLIPGYLKINYEVVIGGIAVSDIAQDDGNGNIFGTYLYGSIDYNTSIYTIYPYLKNDVYQAQLGTSTISGVYNQFLNYNIIANTFYIYYEISDTAYIGMDDGNGYIIGTGITTGNLNYTTGQLNITFNQPTQSGYITSCNYSYKTIPTIISGTLFLAEYKVSNKLEITEFGIEDENKNVLAYTTFPKVQFDNIYNNLSIGTFIKI
jgi:hypothetical protein